MINITKFNSNIEATRAVGKLLKKQDIVIYESTVYPGLTEEVCVPELEKISKLNYNIDFYCVTAQKDKSGG